MVLATPLALGSLWAFVCAVLLCGVIAARLLDEERYLSRGTCPVTKVIEEGSIPTDSPRLVNFVLRVLCRYFIFCQPNEDAQTSGYAQTDELNRSKTFEGFEHLQEDSMARRVEIPCRHLLRRRRDSFLPLPSPRFGAALGHEVYRDARDQRRALHSPCCSLPDLLLPRFH